MCCWEVTVYRGYNDATTPFFLIAYEAAKKSGNVHDKRVKQTSE